LCERPGCRDDRLAEREAGIVGWHVPMGEYSDAGGFEALLHLFKQATVSEKPPQLDQGFALDRGRPSYKNHCVFHVAFARGRFSQGEPWRARCCDRTRVDGTPCPAKRRDKTRMIPRSGISNQRRFAP
jgi:hypothetical protein